MEEWDCSLSTAVCASLHLFSSCLFWEQAAPMDCLTGFLTACQEGIASLTVPDYLEQTSFLWSYADGEGMVMNLMLN